MAGSMEVIVCMCVHAYVRVFMSVALEYTSLVLCIGM